MSAPGQEDYDEMDEETEQNVELIKMNGKLKTDSAEFHLDFDAPVESEGRSRFTLAIVLLVLLVGGLVGFFVVVMGSDASGSDSGSDSDVIESFPPP
eukprot:CAMPEP_0198221604 /NCGR_PEP_ID=MMETSP1445-20131203/84365_1 /TAXON_ID=36898 /ORGANISM="Pyramimonas sp., Strain CCMP2087" /LENGTH=96 /DNA_ID=CAMNT_0043899809 /DNA_START=217 /DNA_END=503 /DNA_ORIENTATION=+